MPYIKQERRLEISQQWDTDGYNPQTPGELNYAITDVVKQYLDTHKLSYQTINDILGALEGAKLEFYRRVVAPYEDTKIKENGDVY